MGPDSRFSLGGIPSQVAHHSPVDILVVRTSDPTREHTYRKALLATDGSLTAHQATRHGDALARALGADVALIYVGDELIGDIVLRDTAARLDHDGIEQIVTRGNPAVQWGTKGWSAPGDTSSGRCPVGWRMKPSRMFLSYGP
jgi:nucleotide-binding universal stress UspA family protein